MRVQVHVTLKTDVLDPQGEAVRRALASLGFDGVRGARIGKLVDLELDAPSEEAARTQAEEMGKKLLANPVIEDFRVASVEG